jgi:hypothetical protein
VANQQIEEVMPMGMEFCPLRIRSRFIFLTLFFVGSLAWSAPPKTAQTEQYSGVAQDPKTHRVLYKERHRLVMENGLPKSSRTDYTGPTGTPWATLKTQFTHPKDRFSHTYEDLRSGESHGVDLNRRGSPIMFNRDQRSDAFKREPHAMKSGDPVTVAGQGFHWLIRDLVLQGKLRPSEGLTFRLLIPGRFDYFTFKIKAKREVGDRLYIAVDLDSFFLRVIAGASMKVVYSRKTGRLLEYVGPSNIVDDNGDAIKRVKITYRYTR